MTNLFQPATATGHTYSHAMELADLASESIIVSDAHGVIRYWNAASEALYGWPAMAMMGQMSCTI